MVKKSGVILSVLLLLCISIVLCACDSAENLSQSQTEALTESSVELTAAETNIAKTTVSETTVSETTVPEEELAAQAAAAEAQRKLDVIKQFTVEMDEEEAEWYWNNTFLHLYMAPMMHWEPMLFFKNWSDSFTVHELDLEYDDPIYGTVELCFTGSRIHDIFMSDIYFCNYPDCTIHEKNGAEHFLLKSAVEDQDVYIVGLCEGQPFGMPEDGGTGPFWAIRVEDGKAEVISRNVVMLKVSLPRADELPSIDYKEGE